MTNFDNISYMISHIFLMAFIFLFVNHRYSRQKTAAVCFLSFLTLTVTDLVKLSIFPDSDPWYAVITIFQILVTQFTGIFIAEKRNAKVLFIGLSASNYVIAGSTIGGILLIFTGSVPFSLAGSFFAHLAILLFLCKKIRRLCLKWYDKESLQDLWELCLIPVFFYCSFSCLAFFPQTLYDAPDNIPAVIVFIITMFVSYVVVLRYVESESNRENIYWKNVLFESYIKGLENQYHLVEQSEKNLRILRHDMRHYSAMIASLLAQEEYDQIRKLTEHISETSSDMKVVKYSQNIVVNAIFSKVMEDARSYDIDVRSDIQIPEMIPVGEYEFAAVIANLFENAFNCVRNFDKEKRYVTAQIHTAQDHLLIKMQNPYEKEIFFDPVSGLPKSKKGANHGLGMQSISAFADRIGGSIGCFCEDGLFHIMLFAKL